MNTYLRAIGFSNIKTEHDEKNLVNEAISFPDEKYILGKNKEDIYIEYYKRYGDNFGISLRGYMDENEEIVVETWNPYNYSSSNLKCNHIDIEYNSGNYIAIFEDYDTGNELVFLLQNILKSAERKVSSKKIDLVNVSGLSIDGTVILPIAMNNKMLDMKEKEEKLFKELLSKARSGDNEAKSKIESQESKTGEILKERLQEEDFLSVVEGFFMPIEGDDIVYSILGDIVSAKKIRVAATSEDIFKLKLNVTGTEIDICINSKDLVGNPSKGMRFLGTCMLQGRILF